jgi:hypothetical protein
MSSNQYIPDISFHLIFCFLKLKELPHIEQCCHRFKRLVTNESFLKMFSSSHQEEVIILPTNKKNDSRRWNLLIASPFQSLVQNVELYYNDFSLEEALPLFEQFKHLHNLNLNYIRFENINQFSSISQLKKLETLRITFNHIYSFQCLEYIIEIVRALPELLVLDVEELFGIYKVENIRLLCAQPGAPFKLTTIKSITSHKLDHQNQKEISDLFQQLPALCAIELKGWCYSLPQHLAKWVNRIHFDDYEDDDHDIETFEIFNRIESITIIEFCISSLGLEKLIRTNFSRLKHLTFERGLATLSFTLISKCTELIVLNISHCNRGLISSEFHLLNNCTKLKELRLHKCGINLSEQQKATSKLFLSLRICQVSERFPYCS